MVFVTITKEAPRRGLQSQPLPTPKANGRCPTIRVPAPNAGLVPGTYARELVVLSRLQVQRWQCKACLGSASPLPPGVTAHQRPQTFRELVTAMYVYRVSFRGLVRLLDLPGCGMGATTRWRPAGDPTRRRSCHRGSRWTRPGCPSAASSILWSWGPRGNGWTCA